jgi:hypothetical protein
MEEQFLMIGKTLGHYRSQHTVLIRGGMVILLVDQENGRLVPPPLRCSYHFQSSYFFKEMSK